MKGGKAGEPARAAPRSPPRPGPRPGESPRTRGQTQSLPGTAAKQAGSAPSRGRQRDRGAAGRAKEQPPASPGVTDPVPTGAASPAPVRRSHSARGALGIAPAAPGCPQAQLRRAAGF